MKTKDLVLNIAVNLDRISRFAMDGKKNRVKQFINDNDLYINEVNKLELNKNFKKTFDSFENKFSKLRDNDNFDDKWCEEILTWANILEHRAKLA